ncbi:MAG: SAM-dependent methyltransferase [Candidatus Saccharibacteria bacterium]|nr:SAM-dependent methyltransferase [Candidatus Saccharibacteria bacterium]
MKKPRLGTKSKKGAFLDANAPSRSRYKSMHTNISASASAVSPKPGSELGSTPTPTPDSTPNQSPTPLARPTPRPPFIKTLDRKKAPNPIRGYLKIENAAKAFAFDFRGKTVLDIGSSTGGFTEFVLNHGALKVIAIEKGTNQMKSPLRYDPRIKLHEKTDIFNVTTHTSQSPQKLTIEPPDVIVADVSFLSLTKILSYAKNYLSKNSTEYLVMLKPQFEARTDQLQKGVVKNEKIRREIIHNFEFWLKRNGFLIIKKRDNSLPGRNGNLERFYWLRIVG